MGSYLEDFQVGDRLRTPGRTVTEADVVLFASMMGDWRPPHTDEEHAQSTAPGQRVAHDMLVLDIACGLMYRAGGHAVPPSTLALWGVEQVRFVAPVRIGDTLRLESELVQLTKVDEQRGLLTVQHRGTNQRDEEVLTYTTKIVVPRRKSSGGEDG